MINQIDLIEKNLSLYYPFDSADGLDSSVERASNNADLIFTGSPPIVGGIDLGFKGGQRLARSFDGSTQRAAGSGFSGLGPALSTQLTISFWTKISTPSATNCYVFSRRDNVGSGQDNYAIIYGFTANKFEIYADPAGYTGTAPRTATTGTITDSLWHHLAVTYDGTNVRWYIDGKLDTTSAKTFSFANLANTNVFMAAILSSGTPVNYYPGIIDGFRIYKRPLSDGEILAQYTSAFRADKLRGRFPSLFKAATTTTTILPPHLFDQMAA